MEEIDYDLWNDIAVLSCEIRDLETECQHSPQFIEVTYPVLLARINEIMKILNENPEEKRKRQEEINHKISEAIKKQEIRPNGRPPKITGTLGDFVMRCHNDKMSSRKIAKELLDKHNLKIHRNTIVNYINKNKPKGDTNGNDVPIYKE